MAALVPGLRSFPGAEQLDGATLAQVVRDNFRQAGGAGPAEQSRLLDEAFHALRVLLEQLYLERCSSSCVTEGVRVDATSQHSQSSTVQGQPQHVFSYRVRVTNLRDEPIQVLGREWTITNDRGKVTAHIPLATNNAVVGQQPVIPPGSCFEYVSGTALDTPAGVQEGKLEVALLEDVKKRIPSRTILAEVKRFAHLQPGVQRGAR